MNKAKPIPLATRRQVWHRSGYQCEACGLPGASHIHHRRLRSQGGTHDPANLLHLHSACHDRVHANPEWAYGCGFLVHSWDDPAAVPVQMTLEIPG